MIELTFLGGIDINEISASKNVVLFVTIAIF